jgi:hypothetical protein
VVRVVNYSRSAIDNSTIIDVEVRDASGALVDGDFTLLVVERS